MIKHFARCNKLKSYVRRNLMDVAKSISEGFARNVIPASL
jgi:hypothetical protein